MNIKFLRVEKTLERKFNYLILACFQQFFDNNYYLKNNEYF